MSTRLLALVVGFCLGVLPACVAHAQADSTETRAIVVLKDGSSYTGRIVREDEREIEMRTLSDARVVIPRDEVRRIEYVEGELEKGRWRALDPNRTRLLFAPTARPLEAGQGYVGVYEIFFPFLAFGAGRVNLAGGVSIFPFVREQLVYFAPKVTVYQGGNVDAALGGMYVSTTAFEEGVGLAYALATVGPPSTSATFGIGFGYGPDGFSSRPAVLAGGEYQISPRTKLLTENYMIPDDENLLLLSLAARTISRGVTADFGLITTPEALQEGGFPFVPLVNFVFTFRSDRTQPDATAD